MRKILDKLCQNPLFLLLQPLDHGFLVLGQLLLDFFLGDLGAFLVAITLWLDDEHWEVDLHQLNQQVGQRIVLYELYKLVEDNTLGLQEHIPQSWLSLLAQELLHNVQKVAARYW